MKDDLLRYLQRGRDSVLWKLDDLTEYDVRRPMVKTGTNLLGLVKHLAGVESLYFGAIFDRPMPISVPWVEDDDDEDGVDMWATPDESRDYIIDVYRQVWVHADATIEALDLDSPGVVPWWSEERKNVNLGIMLTHVIAETHRHAGHADIVRELIDGEIGYLPATPNLDRDFDWDTYRARLEQAARDAR